MTAGCISHILYANICRCVACECACTMGLEEWELYGKSRAWHDFAIREMPSEEVVICSDVLVANSILLRFKLHDPVDEQEREPVTEANIHEPSE